MVEMTKITLTQLQKYTSIKKLLTAVSFLILVPMFFVPQEYNNYWIYYMHSQGVLKAFYPDLQYAIHSNEWNLKFFLGPMFT